MIVVWTQGAREDLQNIFEYIAEDQVSAAHSVTERIVNAAEHLTSFPLLGRSLGPVALRELVVRSLPYVIRYSVEGEYILITRVRHGALDDREGRP